MNWSEFIDITAKVRRNNGADFIPLPSYEAHKSLFEAPWLRPLEYYGERKPDTNVRDFWAALAYCKGRDLEYAYEECQ